MFREVRLFVTIAAIFPLMAPESFAAGAVSAQPVAGKHRNFKKGYDAGYRAGYARGYRQAANNANPNPALVPVEMFGVTVYRANPCYQYNDRDWAFEKVC